MKYKNSKKADLSLSTNAIVILILAITILGLGLTFVRGLFKQAETKVTETFSATELANPPTRDKPVTIVPGLLTLREGKSGKVVIAHFNPKSVDRACTLKKGDGTAVPTTAIAGTYSEIFASAQVARIPRDGINSWVLAVQGKSAGPGTDLFSFNVECCDAATGAACAATPVNTLTYTTDLIVKIES